MKTVEIIDMLKSYMAVNGEIYGIRNMGLFGSCARNEQDDSSDVDVIITMDKPSLLKINKVRFELEERLGCKVDLLSSTAILRPTFKKNITRDAIYIR
ncbi:MAG: nucleotidyltransferase domain-containing protein [Bacteroidales bacterium]|nr:nucleotidyltransferase domain-containing protein [Bacteroidales bacterium]MBQ8812726.1 nucleotidyltransferase domain-containing protein [Bacteroidales bacterium]